MLYRNLGDAALLALVGLLSSRECLLRRMLPSFRKIGRSQIQFLLLSSALLDRSCDRVVGWRLVDGVDVDGGLGLVGQSFLSLVEAVLRTSTAIRIGLRTLVIHDCWLRFFLELDLLLQ